MGVNHWKVSVRRKECDDQVPNAKGREKKSSPFALDVPPFYYPVSFIAIGCISKFVSLFLNQVSDPSF
jgi:hypothetical protein